MLQAFHLLPTMTAQENVATPLELAGEPGAWSRAAAELEAVGLGHRLTHYPAQLSAASSNASPSPAQSSRARRCCLRTSRPAILDAATGEAIIDILLRRRAETGATLVIITHDEALAQRCSRIITLADGKIASDRAGAPA